jgi:hypothetical protein
MAKVNPWEEYARKFGLNTEDLKEILSNLENIEANVGYVPTYFEDISPEDLMDSTKWGDSSSQMVKNPNAPAGILASQKIMENPDYGLIPANQAYTSKIIKNTLSEPEYLDWVEKEFKGWEDEDWKKNFMNRTFPSPNNPYQIGTDPSYPFYREKSFSPHPQTFEVQDIIETPILQYLAAQGNPELDLDNPNQKFFPKKGYPEVPLQFLRDYIASGEGVSERVEPGSAGQHYGYDALAGMFNPTDEEKKSWYNIGIDPKFYDQPIASIMGHESGHGAVTAYPNFWLDAPYPFAHLKKGEEYDVMKDIYPEMVGAPSKHFATAHRFHPALHSIDEMFVGGYNQPQTSMDRVNPVNREQAANAMYIINRTMQDERNAALGDWAQSQESEEFFTPSTRGPAGMGSYPSERTSFGLTGPAGMNRGGITSLR